MEFKGVETVFGNVLPLNPLTVGAAIIVLVVGGTSVLRPSQLPLGVFVGLGTAVMVGLPAWLLLHQAAWWPHMDVAAHLGGGR